jgi:hypothetical protein
LEPNKRLNLFDKGRIYIKREGFKVRERVRVREKGERIKNKKEVIPRRTDPPRKFNESKNMSKSPPPSKC